MKRLVWGSSFRRAFKLAFKPDPAGGEQLILLVDIGTHGEVY
jgi:mRNA-degrading endonuclease YafQ of YafQ-DinJ toxin-antitoxin module